MADELNIPTHRWYEPRNNIRLANTDFSKQWIYDSGVQKIDQAIATRLFSVPGSRGFFYDFSDINTLFQDTAGTQPVTTAGQTVALALDKSKGLVLGPELVTNGDFASGTTGWTPQNGATLSIVSGAMRVLEDGVDAAVARAYQVITTVVGRTYKISGAVIAGSTTSGVFAASPTTSFFGQPQTVVAAGTAGSVIFTATTTSTNIILANNSLAAGVYADFDNVSVRELAGNHATQSNLASRPTYALHPSSGIRNVANGSADVGNAAYWPAAPVSNGITATKVASGFDTDGLPYVDVRYQGTATGTYHDTIYSTANSRTFAVAGQSWTASAILRRIGGTLTGVTGCNVSAIEETAPFIFVAQAFGGSVTATTDTLSSGTRTIATGNQARAAVVLTFTNGATIDITYRIKGLQFEQASTYSRYQRVITANEWYEPGFTSYRGIRFDGVDDFLQTAAIDFAGAESLGAELVTNGDFSGGLTGWTDASSSPATFTVSSGQGLLTSSGTTARARQTISTVAGRAYKITFDAVTTDATGCSLNASGVTAGTTDIFAATVTTGTFSRVFVATSSTTYLQWGRSTTGTCTFDNVSVREVLIAGDKMTVVAGVRKLSDAARGFVYVQDNAGLQRIGLEAPSSNLNDYQVTSGGTANVAVRTAVAAPNTSVVTLLGDISAPSVILRRNGTLANQSTASQGAGNYSAQPFYIGRFGGTSLPFNGVLTFLCVINRTLTAAELAQLETIANSRTGAY